MTTFLYESETTVDSSVLTNVYYSLRNHQIAVKFKHGGFRGYNNCDIKTYRKIAESDSPGREYNVYLKESVARPSFDVTDVASSFEDEAWNDTPGATTADAKDFTVVLKIKAADIVDAATKVHGFTSDPFTVVSIGQS